MQTLVAEILAAWRRAERLTGTLQEGTPEHAAAQLACDRLRDLFGELTSLGPVPVAVDAVPGRPADDGDGAAAQTR
jgi:hypothetical protein